MSGHDVVIIGGGSAGYAAARTAAAMGADAAIIDQGPLGGLCILRGCMPTKTILRSAEVMALMRRAEEFGLASVSVKADLAAIIERKARLVKEFADDRVQALTDPRFTLYQAPARFRSPHEVEVDGKVLTAKAFIIATGSVPSQIPIPGLEEVGYVTSDEILELRRMPDSLLVLGGGAVGVELAQFYARIGTRVTMLQRHHHILSTKDEDLARVVEAKFRDEGMLVYTGTQLHRFTRKGVLKTVHFSHQGQDLTASAELILQALGRRANIDRLNLEAAEVRTVNGRIQTDPEMRTNQSHIFAAGDVNNLHDIVHIAVEQGEIAAHNALRPGEPPRRMDDRLFTEVIFTDPQVASVGLGEQDCQARKIPYRAASYPFSDHGKAMLLGEGYGHVKLLCRPDSGELLGAHIVGPEAGELIHELVAVVYFRGTVRDLLRMPHYHPTLAEIVTYPAEALLAQLGG